MPSRPRSYLLAFALVSVVLLYVDTGEQRVIVPLLPAILAIGLALVTRNVLVALFFGIHAGAVAMLPFDGPGEFVRNLFLGLLRVVDTYVLGVLTQPDKAQILIFSLLIGGMVGVIGRSGGVIALVEVLARKAVTRGWSQTSTYLVGILIFFDDYANTLIVGNTFRPLCDRTRVSREKLSFLVDATSAPIASLAMISTWIGYEVGLIAQAFEKSGVPGDAYLAFMGSLPYRFYAVFLLVFIPMLIGMRRDFGPMYHAEVRAITSGQCLRPGSLPLAADESAGVAPAKGHWVHAVAPIATLMAVTLAGLYFDGANNLLEARGADGVAALRESGAMAYLREALSAARSSVVLIWASLLAGLVAMTLVVKDRVLDLERTVEGWISGAQGMLVALVVLCLAWSIGDVVQKLDAASLVTRAVADWVSPGLLPTVIFITASTMSFATGTAWGTMAILFPLSIPLAVHVHQTPAAAPETLEYLNMIVGAILTGSIFGDHCSPISDTTILSATASAVDLMDHVTTQLPYALTVGLIATVAGYLPAGLGVHPLPCTVAGVVAMAVVIRTVGRRLPDGEVLGPTRASEST